MWAWATCQIRPIASPSGRCRAVPGRVKRRRMSDTPLALDLLTASDIPDATALLQQAFSMPRPYGHDLKRHLAMDPASWWLGRMEGQAVGMVGLTDYGSAAYL